MNRAGSRLQTALQTLARCQRPVLYAFVGLLTLLNSAAAQGVLRSVHKNWEIRCATPPGAKSEQCSLVQMVVAEDRANVGLTIIVLKTADKKWRLMRVVAPLGVFLSFPQDKTWRAGGLGVKIDNVNVGRSRFVRCTPTGCIAEIILTDELLNRLKTAKTLTLTVFLTSEEGTSFPVSLAGFAEGYDKLP